MKLVGITLLALGLSVAAASVSAQTGKTTFTLKGHTEGGANFWTEGTAADHNPTLTVPPNTAITVTASSASGTHNLKIGDGAASDPFGETDAAVTKTFTSPASGDVTYICTIHGSEMSGKFHVASAADGSTTTTTNTSPAPTKNSPGFEVVALAVAIAGAVLVLRRK